MERFDTIVVGAGPAGSTAAFRLARAGARVLLLDRARFPRDKPCGGGLTYRAVRQLPVSVDPVVEDVVDRFELGFRYGGRFERGGEGPLVLMTQRRRLDAHLAGEAAAAGADFRDGVRVGSLELRESDATVWFDGSAAAAPVVIGADGVNGLSARALGVGPRRHGVALEGNVSYVYARAREERWRGRAVVELGVVPGGYVWVFPKGDHVNVGVGGWESEGPRLREHLERACSGYGLPSERLAGVRGYRLPMRRPGERAGRERVLLVGDAANQADPLNGGGIHKAMEGASLAADAAFHALTVGDFSHRTLSLYEHLWEESFETDWRTAEFFLAVAKNPALKEFCLFLLTQIGRLTTEDRRFQEFASGVFSGTVAQSACLSPLALYKAFPKNPDAWRVLVQGEHGVAAGSALLVGGAVGSLTRAAGRMVRDPVRNLDWGLEVAVKAVQLAQRGVHGPARRPAGDRYLPASTPANGKA